MINYRINEYEDLREFENKRDSALFSSIEDRFKEILKSKYDPTIFTLIIGTNAVLDEVWSYQVVNEFKNHWRSNLAPTDPQAGMIFSDSDDDYLYHYDSANWLRVIQLNAGGNVDLGSGITWTTGKMGVGTSTVPHGGIGYAILAIDGANASALGAHVQFTTDSDDYPLMQILNFQHDSQRIMFDSYYDGAEKSSDVGSNYMIQKNTDMLKIRYDSGIAQGGAITWNDGLTLDISGIINISGSLTLGTDLAVIHGGTGTSTGAITLVPGAPRTIQIDANTTTVGDQFTISAGRALSGGTDLTGGVLVLASGVGTGAGDSYISFQASKAGASGIADNAVVQVVAIDGTSMTLYPHGVGAGNTSELRFLELAVGGFNYVGFKAPDAITTNLIWTLPSADATGMFMSDGAGVMSLLADVAVGQILISGGVGVSPLWSASPYVTGTFGIGTATVPHGAVGIAKFAIDGTTESDTVGPHVQITTSQDDYPTLQFWNFRHDTIAISFDAYRHSDSSWDSADAGSNFQIVKGVGTPDVFEIRYDSGIAQGGAITWNTGIALDTSGQVGIGEQLYHLGDVDTYLRFQTDQLTLRAGGIDFINAVEAGIDYLQLLTGLNFIGDNANTMMTIGLTIKTTGVDEWFSGKYNGLAHGITTRTETDTFGLMKVTGVNGGLYIQGYSAGSLGITLYGGCTTADNTLGAGAVAPMSVVGSDKNGTTTDAIADGFNVFTVNNHINCIAIFRGNNGGDLFLGGTVSENQWDDYDDLELARSYSLAMTQRWDEMINNKYSRDDLIEAGLIHFTPRHRSSIDKDEVWTSIKNGLHFSFCAFAQIGDKFKSVDEEIFELRAENAELRSQIQSLQTH